jgi:hypothetical protein
LHSQVSDKYPTPSIFRRQMWTRKGNNTGFCTILETVASLQRSPRTLTGLSGAERRWPAFD